MSIIRNEHEIDAAVVSIARQTKRDRERERGFINWVNKIKASKYFISYFYQYMKMLNIYNLYSIYVYVCIYVRLAVSMSALSKVY